MKNQTNKFEPIMWLTAIALISATVSSHYYFSTHSLFLRVLAMIVALALSLLLIAKTRLGHAGLKLWRESLLELRKVVWPTRKETVNSILSVVVMVFVMGLLLGIMDWILSKSLHWLLSIGGV